MACRSAKESSSQPTADDQSEQAMYEQMSGPCFGKCPVYHFALAADGMANLEKKRNFAENGRYQMQLDEATTINIISTLDKAKFMTLPDEYESDIPDLPTTTMIYRKGGTTKSVKAKEQLPQDLRDLQDKVELIIKGKGWETLEVYEKEAGEKEVIEDQVLVQPNDGISLSRWQKRYADYGLRLLTRVDETNNIWLYTWDTTTISSSTMLAYLRKDADLKSAEYNYKVNASK